MAKKATKKNQDVPFVLIVKNELKKRGIKQGFLAGEICVNSVHLSKVLTQKVPLTDSIKQKIHDYFWPPDKKK